MLGLCWDNAKTEWKLLFRVEGLEGSRMKGVFDVLFGLEDQKY